MRPNTLCNSMNPNLTNNNAISDLLDQADEFANNGKYADAVNLFNEVLKIDPNHAETLHLLGMAKYYLGFPDESIIHINKAINIAPENPYYRNNIALIYSETGQISEALSAFKKASELNPDNPNFHFNAGVLYFETGDCESAIECYKNALAKKPDYFEAYNNLGKALQETRKFEEAEQAYRNAIKYNPGYYFAHNNLGTLLQDKGDLAGAKACYEDAYMANPYDAMPLSNLAHLEKAGSTEDEIFNRIIELFESDDITGADEILLSFALGKLFDDCCEYDKAFHNYERGNLLAGLNFKFDINEHEKLINFIKDKYNGKYFGKIEEHGSQSTQPVFIVGMPRSGTSLVEQIIASHSQAFGAGELDFFNNITGFLTQDAKLVRERVEFWTTLHNRELFNAAAAYLELINSMAGRQYTYVTDKMPYNFLHLGLISVMFPNANIIHCRRDPLDTCLSIYFHYFQGFHNYSFNLTDIAQYYKSYDDLMNHWEKVLPNPLITIHYEDLTRNKEAGIHSIIDFLNLPWEDACLEFYNNKQVVQTRSNIQVRKPIYTSSVNRWENYKKHISPLLEAFGRQS